MSKNNKKQIDFAEYEKIINIDISKLKPHPHNEKLLPRLTRGELSRLKERIKKYGFTEPIEVTKTGTVLDGNNRIFKILIPFKKEFEDAGVPIKKVPARIIDIPVSEEADYIISKNFDRRQLSKLMQSYIRGQQYNELKDKRGGDRKSKGKSFTLIDNAKLLADRFGMSDRTIKNDGRFNKLCDDLIRFTDYDFVFNLLNGEIKANKSTITLLAKKPKKLIDEVYSYYFSDKDLGEYPPLKEVIEKINDGESSKAKAALTKRVTFDIKVELEKEIETLSRKKGIDKEKLIEEIIEKGLKALL